MTTLRNFSWILPDKLAGLAMVGRWRPLADELAALRAHRIRLLVTLTGEAISASAARAQEIETLHIPIQDFGPPTLAEIERFVGRARHEIESGGAVAVHCFAGMGRTGTMLAAYLVGTGLSSDAAIARVRQLRPGSIENTSQEEAVARFADHLACQER